MSCVLHSTMKNDRTRRYFPERFPRSFTQFLHRLLFCSHQPKPYLLRHRSDSKALIVSTPTVMTRFHRCRSHSSMDGSHLQLSSYPGMCHSIDQVRCICQESWTFLFSLSLSFSVGQKKQRNCRHLSWTEVKSLASKCVHFSSRFFCLHVHTHIYACNILLFICSYAADVKRRFVIFLHYSFLFLLGMSHS